MPDFKEGDIVRCVDNHDTPFTGGERLEVAYQRGPYLAVKTNTGISSGWLASRFKLIEEPKVSVWIATREHQPAPADEFPVGCEVECVHARNANLVKGARYTVLDNTRRLPAWDHPNTPPRLTVLNEDGEPRHYPRKRFKKVEQEMNKTINPGDKVRCTLNPIGQEPLNPNTIYTVKRRLVDDLIELVEVPGRFFVDARFTRAPSAPKNPFAVGQEVYAKRDMHLTNSSGWYTYHIRATDALPFVVTAHHGAKMFNARQGSDTFTMLNVDSFTTERPDIHANGIRVGDLVRCVRGSNAFTAGNLGEVVGVTADGILALKRNGHHVGNYYARDFVKEPVTKTNKFKAGDKVRCIRNKNSEGKRVPGVDIMVEYTIAKVNSLNDQFVELVDGCVGAFGVVDALSEKLFELASNGLAPADLKPGDYVTPRPGLDREPDINDFYGYDFYGYHPLEQGRTYKVAPGHSMGSLVYLEGIPGKSFHVRRFQKAKAPKEDAICQDLTQVLDTQLPNGMKKGQIVTCIQGGTHNHPIKGQQYFVVGPTKGFPGMIDINTLGGIQITGIDHRRFVAIKPTKKQRVIIESPYGNVDNTKVRENEEYLKKCIEDSLAKGEAPFASHGFYTKVLNDREPHERRQGMESGFAWGEKADLVAVYIDKGMSEGMKEGVERARRHGIPVEVRMLTAGGASWRI